MKYSAANKWPVFHTVNKRHRPLFEEIKRDPHCGTIAISNSGKKTLMPKAATEYLQNSGRHSNRRHAWRSSIHLTIFFPQVESVISASWLRNCYLPNTIGWGSVTSSSLCLWLSAVSSLSTWGHQRTTFNSTSFDATMHFCKYMKKENKFKLKWHRT